MITFLMLVQLRNLLVRESKEELVSEILAGLTANSKYISSRFFYDERGSQLFEEITALPEYYLTRTEKTILEGIAPEILKAGKRRDIVELGSGDSTKISILLEGVPGNSLDAIRYFPVDVSRTAILKSSSFLSQRFPGLRVHGLLADFMKHLNAIPGDNTRLICFFGSTLGNFTRKQATAYLQELGELMVPGDALLLGLDMVKEVRILEAAYNDSRGVTAEFNRNILRVVNQEACTDFVPGNFEHYAFYNTEEDRIEMHLVARHTMEVRTPFLEGTILLQAGEVIHTENSHKFTAAHIIRLAEAAGLEIRGIYPDPQDWFSVVHMVAS